MLDARRRDVAAVLRNDAPPPIVTMTGGERTYHLGAAFEVSLAELADVVYFTVA